MSVINQEKNMDINKFVKEYIEEFKMILDKFPFKEFEKIVDILLTAYNEQKRIFIMGNGGSASTASHFACDIGKGCSYKLDKRFKILCLNDSIPILLAYANDLSYSDIFVEQMKNFFEPGDVVIGISASGNSENVLKAIFYAKKMGGRTVGLSGFDGGKLKNIVDIPLVVYINDMQKVEDIHLIIVHILMQFLNQKLN
jgi:D-sedoheptulose 7-phosphate isomerase